MPIESITHKELRRFWVKGDAKKLPSRYVRIIERQLNVLDQAEDLSDFAAPPLWKFHALTVGGDKRYAFHVSKNWRMTFEFEHGNARNINLEDYH